MNDYQAVLNSIPREMRLRHYEMIVVSQGCITRSWLEKNVTLSKSLFTIGCALLARVSSKNNMLFVLDENSGSFVRSNVNIHENITTSQFMSDVIEFTEDNRISVCCFTP